MLLALLLKLCVTALVVVIACRMVERTGPLIGAMIATLPVSAGPAYAFLAMEHGPAFIAASALASLAALAGTNVFVTIYAWRAPLGPRGPASRWDVPIRAAAAMMLVGLVLMIGRLLGPLAAGVAALAPVVTTSLAILLYPRLGGAGAAAVLANMLPGMLGNSVAVVALCLTAVSLGSTAALLLGLAICIAWNGGITISQTGWRIGRRRAR